MENIRKVVPEEEQGRINLHAYWKIFWRKKFYLLIPLILSGVIAVTGVRRLTPIFESHVLITVEDKTGMSPTIERYVPESDNRSQMRNLQFRSMIETRVTSNDFLKLIVEDLGLQRSDKIRRYVEISSGKEGRASLDDLVMRHLVGLLKEKIEVSSPMPGFYTIGVYDTDPGTAFALAEQVTQAFIDVTRQDQIQGIRHLGAFSDEQLAIYKDKLEASEKELSRVKREMADSDVENNPVNSTNINFARALKQTVDAETERSGIALRRVRERLVQHVNPVPSSDRISSDETVRNYENKLAAYGEEKLLRDLAVTPQAALEPDQYNEAVGGLRSRIADLVQAEYRNLSAEVYPLIVEYFYQESLNEYHTLISRKFQEYVNRYTRSYEMRPGLERDFNRLTQDVETNRAIYRAFLESKTTARISEAAQTTNLGWNISIIERAERPLSPVKPNPIKIMLLAVIFGGACGLGAIIVTEYIDDSFRSIDEVERSLKIPVLGTVPKMAAGFAWERKQRGLMIVSWVVGVVLFVSIMSGALYMYANKLKSSGLGIELRGDQSPTEVQK